MLSNCSKISLGSSPFSESELSLSVSAFLMEFPPLFSKEIERDRESLILSEAGLLLCRTACASGKGTNMNTKAGRLITKLVWVQLGLEPPSLLGKEVVCICIYSQSSELELHLFLCLISCSSTFSSFLSCSLKRENGDKPKKEKIISPNFLLIHKLLIYALYSIHSLT